MYVFISQLQDEVTTSVQLSYGYCKCFANLILVYSLLSHVADEAVSIGVFCVESDDEN